MTLDPTSPTPSLILRTSPWSCSPAPDASAARLLAQEDEGEAEPACRSASRCAHCSSTPPARVTQSTTSFEVEDWKRQVLYFFFRRFVLRAPFFAAAFAFVFRFFAMQPS